MKREFWFNLTGDEIRELGKNAGELASGVQVDQQKFAEVKKEWREKISTQEAELSRMLGVLKTGKELREIECLCEKDFGAGKIVFRNTATNQVLEERDMEDAERQTSLLADNVQQMADTEAGKTMSAFEEATEQ